MRFSLAELADLIGGAVEGDGGRSIRGLAPLETAGPEELSFLTNPRYRREAEASRAGAVLTAPGVDLDRDLLVVEDPYHALARLMAHFHPPVSPPPGVHPSAVVGAGCELDPSVHVGPTAVVGEGSRLGRGVVLHPGVMVGAECQIGEDSVLHPGVVLYPGTVLGARVVLHAGVVLGGDGFGYATHDGVHHKIPHAGRVVVEDDVEIGANSTVDRALLAETRIGAGTKIDNLVQVGHNVVIGRGCLLVSQVGISGSARLGDGVVLAGQAGVAGHLTLEDGVQVAAKSAVFRPVSAGRKVAGIPAVEAAAWHRQRVLLERLGEIHKRLKRLEGKLRRSKEDEE